MLHNHSLSALLKIKACLDLMWPSSIPLLTSGATVLPVWGGRRLGRQTSGAADVWGGRRLGRQTSGAATSGPATSGPATSGPAPSGPAPSGPAPSGPAPSGPAPSGPAPSGPAPSGPAPSVFPEQKTCQMTTGSGLRGLAHISFNPSLDSPTTPKYSTLHQVKLVLDQLHQRTELSCARVILISS